MAQEKKVVSWWIFCRNQNKTKYERNTSEGEFGEILLAKISSRSHFGSLPSSDWSLKSLFLAKKLDISIFRSFCYEASQMAIIQLTFDNMIALLNNNFKI